MAQFYARATVTTQFVEIRFEVAFSLLFPNSNHICLVTFMCFTVDTSFIFTTKSNVAKCFFDICNAEMAQWHQKS